MERVGPNEDCLRLTTKDDRNSLYKSAVSLAILGLVSQGLVDTLDDAYAGSVLDRIDTDMALEVAEIYLTITKEPIEMTQLCLAGALRVFERNVPGEEVPVSVELVEQPVLALAA